MKQAAHLTISDLITLFGVSAMTVYNWRQGSTRIPKLPCKTKVIGNGTRHTVYFLETAVLAWAKKNDIPVVGQLNKVV